MQPSSPSDPKLGPANSPAGTPVGSPHHFHGPRVSRERMSSTASTILIILAAPAIALMINAFIFQSYEVDGSSMEPTLQNTNRLIVDKIPKTWGRITGKAYVPHRHDIIVFKKPNDESEQLIKRVIGLPGDRVVVKDSHITIYNKANPTGFNPDVGDYASKLSPTDGFVDVIVHDGEVFVCGDNRVPGASLDSRSALGNIPVKNIVGKLELRLLPLDKLQKF